MKYMLFTLSWFLMFSNLPGQQFDIIESQYQHDGIVHDAIKLSIKADKSEAKKAWNSFIQDVYNVDIKGYGIFAKKDELKTGLIPLSFLSQDNLTLNSHFKKNENHTDIIVFTSKKNNIPLTNQRDSVVFNNLASLTEEYVAYFLPDYHNERVKTITQNLEDVINDIKDKQEKIADNKNDILELQEEIRSLESELIEDNFKKEKAQTKLDKSLSVLKKVQKATSDL